MLVTENVPYKTRYFSEICSHSDSNLSWRDGGQTRKGVIVTVPPRAGQHKVLRHNMDLFGGVAKWTGRGTVGSAQIVFGNRPRSYIPKMEQKGMTDLTREKKT